MLLIALSSYGCTCTDVCAYTNIHVCALTGIYTFLCMHIHCWWAYLGVTDSPLDPPK